MLLITFSIVYEDNHCHRVNDWDILYIIILESGLRKIHGIY